MNLTNGFLGFLIGIIVSLILAIIARDIERPHFISIPEDIKAAKVGDILSRYQEKDTMVISFNDRVPKEKKCGCNDMMVIPN